jgi:hypothetical protein
MVKTGYHINQQKIYAGCNNIGPFYDVVYWIQWRVTILAIPLYVRNIKAFGSTKSALDYINEISGK